MSQFDNNDKILMFYFSIYFYKELSNDLEYSLYHIKNENKEQ